MGRASPLQMTRRRLVQLVVSVVRKALSMEGTKWMVVMCSRWMVVAM